MCFKIYYFKKNDLMVPHKVLNTILKVQFFIHALNANYTKGEMGGPR